MAGAKVRGITIELSADASGVITGLKQVNSAVRTTQQQLKDVNRLLKLDPTNITLLKQRTQLLQQQIGNTKQKLSELKKAEADMKARGIDENSEQFQALQREIIATEQKLKELNNTAGSGSAKMLQISNATKAFGEKAEAAGQKLLPVTAGIVGLGVAAVKTAADFDAQMSKVQAISGATADDMASLEAKAREMGEKTKFSAQEAGEGFEYMAMAGWKTEDMLEGIEPILNLAAASGEELGTTSDIVTDALTAFGLTAKDAGRFADIMAAASSNANTNVSMLGESFKYAAPVAGALGFSAEDVATALGLMANSGIKASSAGTALRTLFTNMSKPTNEMAAAMETLGVSLDDGQGNMKSFREVMQDLRKGFKGLKTPEEDQIKALAELDKELADGTITEKQYNKLVAEWTKSTYGAEGALKAEAAAALAGKQGMSGLLAIVNASDDDFNKLTSAIDNSQGSAQKMAETMQDNLAGQITILKSQLSELAISFGKILMPIVRNVVSKIQELVDRFNNLDDSQKKTIVKIGAVVAALGPALIILGKLSSAISSITELLSKMKITSFLTNPVTLAVGAVAALAAGLAILITNIEDSNNSLIGYREELKELKSKNDDLAASIEATNKQLDHNVEQAQVEADTAGKLADQLDILTGKENKTAADKEQILKLVEQLNELVPDLQLAYDKEADSLNRTNEQIRANIELRKQQATVDAYSKAYTEALEEQAQAQINLAEAQELFDEMLNGTTDDVRAHWEEWDKFGELGVPWDGLEMAKYRGEMVELEKAQKAVSKAQTNVTNATKQSERVYGLLTEQTEVLANEQQKMSKTLNATDLAAFREEVQNTLGENFTTQLNDAINNAAKAGVEIPEDLKQGILSGKVPVNEAVKQINTMVKNTLAENKKNAATAGTQTGTSYSSSLAAQKSKSKEAALDNVKAAKDGLNTGKTPAGTIGGDTGEKYGGGILSKKDLASGNAAAVRNAALNGLKGDSYSRGVELVDGYVRGIIDNAARAATAAVNMVWSAITGIRNAQESGSPSRVAMTIGEELGEGYSIGILDTIRDAMKAGADLAKGAIEGISDYNQLNPSVTLQGATTGNYGTFTGATVGGSVSNSESIVNNNYTQNNYSPRALTTSEIYRQTNNLIALNGVLL